MDTYDIINTYFELQKTRKPITTKRICQKCNKTMRAIKKDFLNRPHCKKCHLELREDFRMNFCLGI